MRRPGYGGRSYLTLPTDNRGASKPFEIQFQRMYNYSLSPSITPTCPMNDPHSDKPACKEAIPVSKKQKPADSFHRLLLCFIRCYLPKTDLRASSARIALFASDHSQVRAVSYSLVTPIDFTRRICYLPLRSQVKAGVTGTAP